MKPDDPRARVLIVDDEPAMCLLVQEFLAPMDVDIETVTTPSDALARLRAEVFDVLVVDYHLPEMTGTELIAEARRISPKLRAILMSALDPQSIVENQIPTDVYDFVAKPLNATEVRYRLRRALRDEGERSRPSGRALGRRDDMLVGSSKAMQEVFNQLRVLTQNDIAVLLGGESGTGKELVARTIHHLGHRFDRPFVAVNCSAIPDTLIEAELFGHVRGAFTGATHDRDGLFAAAEGGTIFLDEIGELPRGTQVTLLRVLERGEYRRVGESQVRFANARLVSATNRDLAQAVTEGRFREDLLYRINVFSITLPPLRARGADIPMLANHFLRRHAMDGDPVRLTRAALVRLMSHAWPGNVRELENVVRQGIALAEDGVIDERAIRLVSVPRTANLTDTSLSYREAKQRLLASFEREYVVRILREHDGNVSAAARAAGVHRKSFWTMMRRSGVDPDDYRT